MGGRDWIDDEPGMIAWVRELQRVLRRAKARPFITLLVAALLTAAIVTWRVRRVDKHTATVVLRFQESPFTMGEGFMQRGDLVDYVWSVILAKQVVLDIIEQLDVYPGTSAAVPDLAIDRFHDGLNLEEYRNYFLWGRDEGELRSARLAIEFTDPSASKAAAVAEEIARRVIDHEAERRLATGERSQQAAELAVAEARAALEQREAEVLTKDRVMPADTESVKQYQTRLEQAEQQLERVRLAIGAERRAIAPTIEIARVDRPTDTQRLPSFYAMLGGVVFIFMIGISAVGVGAFGAAVRDTDDLQRLGIPAVGHVPSFPHCEAGSLRDRLRNRKG